MKKEEKLILTGNVKQTASANNNFTSSFIKQTARENNICTGGLLNTAISENNIFTGGFLKQPASANVIFTDGCIKKTTSGNNICTSGLLNKTAGGNNICTGGLLKKTASETTFSLAVFLSNPPVQNVISTSGCKTTASEKADFYRSLALAALKNASANSSRTATIELLCTSARRL